MKTPASGCIVGEISCDMGSNFLCATVPPNVHAKMGMKYRMVADTSGAGQTATAQAWRGAVGMV